MLVPGIRKYQVQAREGHKLPQEACAVFDKAFDLHTQFGGFFGVQHGEGQVVKKSIPLILINLIFKIGAKINN